MALSWHALLDDPSKILEWVVKVEGFDHDNDVALTFYVLSPNSGRTDTPSAPVAATVNSLGTISETISEDSQFAGISALTIGTLVLNNEPIAGEDEGPLDSWTNYTFDGYKVTYYLLELGSAFGSPDPFRVSRQHGEPVFNGNTVTIDLESVLTRLDRNLRSERYVGIPVCLELLTNLGNAAAPTHAIYSAKSFTIMGRFKSATIDATQIVIMRRGPTAGNRHFNVFIRNTAPIGVLDFQCSFGGVSTTVARTTFNVDDSVYHEFICAVLDNGDAYMIVDGELVDRVTPGASVDLPASSIEFGNGGAPDRRILDMRFYNVYLDENDALSAQSTLGTSDDYAIKGLWNFDDNAGATGTDYSPTANNAAIAGVLNTAYRWVSSDLGTPQLAGQVVPWAMGFPFNEQAQLINATDGGGRYQYDEDPASMGAPTVKSRGAVLTLTTDYTEPVDGVLRMVSAQSDPITVDMTVSNIPYASDILEDILLNRGGYDSSEISGSDFDAFAITVPMPASYRVGSDVTGKQAAQSLLGGVQGHLRETHEGKLVPGLLLPPSGPGPHDEVYNLESIKGGGLVFGDIADQTGSFSIACWVRPYRLVKDEISSAVSDEFVISKLDATTGYWMKFPIGAIGQISFGFRAATVDSELLTSEGVLKWSELQFIVGVFNASTDTLTIYWALEGSTLKEMATVGGKTAVPSGNAASLSIGAGLVGMLAELSVWNKALTIVEAQAIMDATPTVPTTNLVAFCPLNEGTGDVLEQVSSTTAALSFGMKWQPEATFDLNQDTGVELNVRNLRPVRRVKVNFRHNYLPMTPADIVSSVSLSNRWDLIRPFRSATVFLKDIDNAHPNARDLVVDSQVINTQDARRIGRLIMNRFSRNRQAAFLGQLDKRCCKLEPGSSQVYVVSPRYGLSSGRHFRVTSVNKALDALRGDVLLWS